MSSNTRGRVVTGSQRRTAGVPTPSPQPPAPTPAPVPAPAPAPSPGPAPSSDGLSFIDHIVVLMLENRSFDHMLGFLYTDSGNVSSTGQAFDGLTGQESNPDASGAPVTVRRIDATTTDAYFLPGADPGEGFAATNQQLFGTATPAATTPATNQGFVTNYAATLSWESKKKGWKPRAGTVAGDIMAMHTPASLPVLSGLAKGYAVSDRWFSPVPTETMPNRAFACAATSQGHMDDVTKSFTSPSIFGLLTQHGIAWKIHGYTSPPLTRQNFPDTTNAPDTNFGLFADFQADAAAGRLAAFTFLEPDWSAAGNSQHPDYDVAAGEQLILDVYNALVASPQWNSTLLVITYDEHGGCYDHVPPPGGATPPDNSAGEFAFDFTRFGVRVPAVLVSPLIAAGTVLRAPEGAAPFDHTSILKTVERRWGLPSLTARDANAIDVGAALTLSTPRTDDPLKGVVAPATAQVDPATVPPSHLELVHAELVARLPGDPDAPASSHAMPAFESSAQVRAFIEARTEAWRRSPRSSGSQGSVRSKGSGEPADPKAASRDRLDLADKMDGSGR